MQKFFLKIGYAGLFLIFSIGCSPDLSSNQPRKMTIVLPKSQFGSCSANSPLTGSVVIQVLGYVGNGNATDKFGSPNTFNLDLSSTSFDQSYEVDIPNAGAAGFQMFVTTDCLDCARFYSSACAIVNPKGRVTYQDVRLYAKTQNAPSIEYAVLSQKSVACCN